MKVTPKIVTPYYVSRRCVTGANEYKFFRGFDALGNATAYTFPNFPLYISGAGVKLRSTFDSTVFPGCVREIRYIDDNEVLATITYRSDGRHSLTLGEETIEVQSEGRNYLFYKDRELAAEIQPSNASLGTLGDEGYWSLRYAMLRRMPLSELMELLILSFPLLQIAP